MRTLTSALTALSLLALAPSAHALFTPPGVGSGMTVDMRKPVIRKTKQTINPRDGYALRNAQRLRDLTAIANAVFFYKLDNQQVIPKWFPYAATEICRTDATDCTGLLDMDILDKYLKPLPVDPQPKNPNSTGYALYKDFKGHLFFTAPLAERGWNVKVQK